SDGEHRDPRILQPPDLARHEAAFSIPGVRPVEEIARVEEEVDTLLDGGVNDLLEAALERPTTLLQTVRAETGAVGAQLVVAREDGSDHGGRPSPHHSQTARGWVHHRQDWARQAGERDDRLAWRQARKT